MPNQKILTQHNPYTGSYEDLRTWVRNVAEFCEPDLVHWCDGSQAEYNEMAERLVNKGTFIRLNPEKWPNCFACFSDPSDVARVEDRTFICSRTKDQAGPTNNWVDPKEMRKIGRASCRERVCLYV